MNVTDNLVWSLVTEKKAISTSDLAKSAAVNGAASGTCFLAIEQTAGRGRHGREWISKKGGMYLSVLIRPTLPIHQWFAFSFAAALAVRDTLRNHIENELKGKKIPEIGLKWPNDVLVSGGKIAGILLEMEGQALIIGVGINIVSIKGFDHFDFPPVALADVLSKKKSQLPTPNSLANELMKRLAYWFKKLELYGFKFIRYAWLKDALYLGKTVAANQGTKKIFGTFHDLNMDGAMLLLDDSGKIHHITTSEVEILGV
tara:strand:- start:290 stop:1063 length:774 start_codon:yes stop_codon:yes gene_type:complete